MNPLKLTRKSLSLAEVEGEIQTIKAIFRAEIHPTILILFGSAARGEMTDQSDLDLLVVMNSTAEIRLAQKKFTQSRPVLPRRSFDVVWLTAEEFEARKVSGGVAMIAQEEGRRLL